MKQGGLTLQLRLRNDLGCVGWGDKLYSLTHSLLYSSRSHGAQCVWCYVTARDDTNRRPRTLNVWIPSATRLDSIISSLPLLASDLASCDIHVIVSHERTCISGFLCSQSLAPSSNFLRTQSGTAASVEQPVQLHLIVKKQQIKTRENKKTT